MPTNTAIAQTMQHENSADDATPTNENWPVIPKQKNNYGNWHFEQHSDLDKANKGQTRKRVLHLRRTDEQHDF